MTVSEIDLSILLSNINPKVNEFNHENCNKTTH